MPSTTTILITGANRGIGRALASIYLQRPNTTLIVTVRDPQDPTAKSLSGLPRAAQTSLIVIQIDSAIAETAHSAISELQTKHKILKVDTVIANAGIGTYYVPAAVTDIEEVRKHHEVNTIGPLVLFQATLPLLKAAGEGAKFIVISSILGSIGAMEKAPLPTAAYGASKSAVNFLAKKIHQEHPDLVVVPVHPGWINTPLGNGLATLAGLPEAPDTLEVNSVKLVELFDKATREEHSGKFWNFDGTPLPW